MTAEWWWYENFKLNNHNWEWVVILYVAYSNAFQIKYTYNIYHSTAVSTLYTSSIRYIYLVYVCIGYTCSPLAQCAGMRKKTENGVNVCVVCEERQRGRVSPLGELIYVHVNSEQWTVHTIPSISIMENHRHAHAIPFNTNEKKNEYYCMRNEK